ncbi:MAG: IS4 family transposase [Adhaeribacter sp.]
MKAQEVIDLIPDSYLDFLSASTKVDYKVQKLNGKTIFKLLVYSLLTAKKSSLRVLEVVFNSFVFQTFAQIIPGTQTRFNSIRDRINTIQADFFENLFTACYDLFANHLNKKTSLLLRYDSTMVALSGKLLQIGMKVGSRTTKKQLKFTIGFDGLLPRTCKLFHKQDELSEDITLRAAIVQASQGPKDMAVFDRGLQKRATFIEFDQSHLQFVTRLKTNALFEVVKQLPLSKAQEHDPAPTVDLQHDELVYLYGNDHQLLKHAFRLIRGIIKATGEEIWFLTNIKELSAYQIAAIYKLRWDIEVFFKFLKQELNFDHVLVRTENAIRVLLYTTLITAMLLIVYKNINKMAGYKIPKLRFALDLEEELIKFIVLLCGGNPNRFYTAP